MRFTKTAKSYGRRGLLFPGLSMYTTLNSRHFYPPTGRPDHCPSPPKHITLNWKLSYQTASVTRLFSAVGACSNLEHGLGLRTSAPPRSSSQGSSQAGPLLSATTSLTSSHLHCSHSSWVCLTQSSEVGPLWRQNPGPQSLTLSATWRAPALF